MHTIPSKSFSVKWKQPSAFSLLPFFVYPELQISGYCFHFLAVKILLHPIHVEKQKKKNYPLSGLKLNPAGQKKKPRQRQSHVRTSTASDAGMTKLPLRLPRDYDACHRRSSAVAVAGRGVGPSTRTSLDLFNTPTPAPTARCAYNPRDAASATPSSTTLLPLHSLSSLPADWGGRQQAGALSLLPRGLPRLRPDDAGGKCRCDGAGGAEEEGGELGSRAKKIASFLFSAFVGAMDDADP